MPRPRAADPKTQKAIYPGRSLWQKFEAYCYAQKVRPAEQVVKLVTEWTEKQGQPVA